MKQSHRARRKPLPGWAKVFLVLTLLVGLGLATVTLLGMAATAQWNRYAATLRAAGEPLTHEEIEARREKIPEDQNGARVIERLADQLKAADDDGKGTDNVLLLGKRSRIRVGDNLVPILRGAALDVDFFTGIARHTIEPSRAFLGKHGKLLDELAALRDKPTGRFHIAYQQNLYYTLLPHLSAVRTASKLVALQQSLKLIDNDIDGAAGDVVLVLHMASTLTDEPFLISQLVRIATESLAMDLAESTLRAGEISRPVLKELTETLNHQRRHSSMIWGLWGERAGMVEFCNQVVSGNISLSDPFVIRDNPFGVPHAAWWFFPRLIVRKNQIQLVKLLNPVIAACEDPVALYKAYVHLDQQIMRVPRLQFLVHSILPSLTRSTRNYAWSLAKIDGGRVALAAERFRMDKGTLPGSIEELFPDYLDSVPADPFDGNPMRFLTTEQGIVIYSVGPNRVDDHGRLVKTKRSNPSMDVGFRLVQPDRRGVILFDEPLPVEP